MNLHPILVHFPIALLSLYTLVEIVRFKKVTDHPSWFYIKAVLAVLGTIAAFAAIVFGDTAAEAVRDGLVLVQVSDPMSVIELHETLAQLGTAIFILPAASYAVAWLNQINFIEKLPGNIFKSIWRMGTKISDIIIKTKLVILLALIGAGLITIAAALGGSIIYGPDNDPFIKLIFHLFFK